MSIKLAEKLISDEEFELSQNIENTIDELQREILDKTIMCRFEELNKACKETEDSKKQTLAQSRLEVLTDTIRYITNLTFTQIQVTERTLNERIEKVIFSEKGSAIFDLVKNEVLTSNIRYPIDINLYSEKEEE